MSAGTSGKELPPGRVARAIRLLIAAVAVVLGIPGAAGAHAGETFVVKMQGGAFTPPTVTIRQGDSVVFENHDAKPRWPASNIHPTHHIYPEFDPRKAVLPGEHWRFTFERTGVWNFHDHLEFEVSGSVVVEPDTHDRREFWDARLLRALMTRVVRLYHDARIRSLRFYFRTFPRALDQRVAGLDIRRVASDEQALRDWLAILGPQAVIARLLRDSDGGRVFECHQPAHQVGRIAYELYGAGMFQHGDMSCNAGYYHGAMEAFLAEKGTASLASDVHQLCSGLPTRFARYSCLHGVGHGVMAYENYDLPKALETCRRLPTEYTQRSCYSGVFMENVVVALGIGVLPGHRTRWMSREDPHFPCPALDPDHKVQYHCYHFQTSWMLVLYKGDFDKVVEQCLRARVDMVPVCFDSFGRDAATQALRDPAKTLALCEKVPRVKDYYAKCLSGAIPVITDFWGAGLQDQATELCRLAPAEGKPACYMALHGRLLELFRTPDERAQICRGFEPPYHKMCG